MSFNVVISSEERISGSSVTNAEYYFDWNNFREDSGSYEMSFVYQSEPEANYNNINSNKVVMLSLPDLPQLNYKTNQTQIGANTSGVVGILFPCENDSKLYYDAKHLDNPPVYVKSLPQNANFKVDLVGDVVLTAPASYKLILSFKKK